MSIPKFQEVMLPFLERVKDKNEYSTRGITEILATDMKLTAEERNEVIPNRKITYFHDRVGWARTYLKFAGLIEQTGYGVFKITDRGLKALNEKPQRIDIKYLYKFDEFRRWYSGGSKTPSKEPATDLTLEEMIAIVRNAAQKTLSRELLDAIQRISSDGFERLVLDLCKKMGYGEWAEHTGKSGDGGIDGIIKEDKLGLGQIYLQAKKWEGKVSASEVRKFVGSLQATKTKKGIFITTSDFTADGKKWAESLNNTTIVLINGELLAELMSEYGVGVSTSDTIKIKKIDHEYFEQYTVA